MIALMLAVLVLQSGTPGDIVPLNQFRSHSYGTHITQVLLQEKDKSCQAIPAERKGIIVMQCFTVLYDRSTPMQLVFRAEDGALIGGQYEYPLWMGEDTLAARKGLLILSVLKEKYGEPQIQKENFCAWKTPVGKLTLQLNVTKMDRILIIRYEAQGDVFLKNQPKSFSGALLVWLGLLRKE